VLIVEAKAYCEITAGYDTSCRFRQNFKKKLVININVVIS
ncbi:unnamed protein product, partial [Acidithrix sp. C25]